MLEGARSGRGGHRVMRGGTGGSWMLRDSPALGGSDPKKPNSWDTGFLGFTLLSLTLHQLQNLAALSLAVVISLGWR